MPRAGRVFFDGAIYHVYNRLARGERAFADESMADAFTDLLQEVMARDGVRVFAWALLPNHYHLAVQAGAVAISRPMKSLQQGMTRRVNIRQRVFGPLWQGRYKAKLVRDQRYLDQLLAYIHLNPVSGGLVEDPAKYRWSGHREILGRVKARIIAVDEVLRVFGSNRMSARRAYARTLRGAREEEWVGENPGFLPWWRLGRPAKSEAEDPEESGRRERLDDLDRQSRERPKLRTEEFLEEGARILGVPLEELSGRGRAKTVVRAREILAVTGVERYGLRVKDIAMGLGKHPVTGTTWVMRGVRRRRLEPAVEKEIEALDKGLTNGGKTSLMCPTPF